MYETKTYLGQRLLAFWPCGQAGGTNAPNVLAPGTGDLVQSGGVTQVPGPSLAIPHATGIRQGASQYLNAPLNALFTLPPVFSFGFWAKIYNTTFLAYLLNMLGPGGNPDNLNIVFEPGPPLTTFLNMTDIAVNSQTLNDYGPNPATDNGWHYWAVIFDGNVLRLVIDNGKFDAFVTFHSPLPTSQNSLAFGGNFPGNTFGDVDACQLGMWSRILTAQDLLLLFNNGEGYPFPF